LSGRRNWKRTRFATYFNAPDGKMMAASIATTGDTLTPGPPSVLFPTHLAAGGKANKQQYVVSRRFLLNEVGEAATSTPITLLLNWHPTTGEMTALT
jgi:hypothetical protein